MTRPRPGPATSAAMVAVAHTCTSASRTPETTSGSASGSSTRKNCCRPVIPIPRAASLTSAGTSRTATYALVMIGGSANSVSAIRVASPARP